jgi:hypothetical protein
MAWRSLILSTLVTSVALIGCGGGSGSIDPPAREKGMAKLDCGRGLRGSKAAFDQYLALLRDGDEAAIRSVLGPRGDPARGAFGWISVGSKERSIIDIRGNPGQAAKRVAALGGLPLRITEFMNIERPRRVTDAGFRGRWGSRKPFVGKGALNCERGTAVVLSVALLDNG